MHHAVRECSGHAIHEDTCPSPDDGLRKYEGFKQKALNELITEITSTSTA